MKKYLLIILSLLLMNLSFSQEMSATKFFETYIQKLDEAHTNLTYVHRKGVAKMGTETIKGEVSGTLYYAVKVKGMGAHVIFRYENFSVEEGWTFNGEIYVVSDINQNGTYSGSVEVKGIEPGVVYYDNVKMANGIPADGYYLIRKNQNLEKISYKKHLEVADSLGIEL